MGNTEWAVLLNGNRIEVSTPTFEPTLLPVLRDLPDRAWDQPGHPGVWSLPVSQFHAQAVVESLKPLGFWIDPGVKSLAKRGAIRPQIKMPPLDSRLFNYQRNGVRDIAISGGRCVLADDCGLGKTPQVLQYIKHFVTGRVLIVCPANVLYKWAEKEIPQWHGGNAWVLPDSKTPILQIADFTLCSYTIMVKRQKELAAMDFALVVFDESHYLRNYKSQRSKAAKLVAKGVPHVICMSGTPFLNRRMELFPNLNMIDPKVWTSAITYGTRYAGGEFVFQKNKGYWAVPPTGHTHTDELKKRLETILIRRTRAEVAPEIPELTRVYVPVEIANLKEYNKVKRETLREFKGRAVALTSLTKLRHVVGLGKVVAAVEMAESLLEQGEQVVLFAHHKDVVDQIFNALHSYGCGVIDGDTPARARKYWSDEFQKGDIRVIICSSAGAEGIDLFAGHYLIMVERLWNQTEEQMERRLQRQGQKNLVTVYYLLARGTVDEKINDIVQDKRGDFSAVLSVDVVREVWSSLLEE